MTGDKITYGESIECPGRWRRMDYETTVKEGETDKEAANRAQSFVQNFLTKEQTPIQDYSLNSITNIRPPETDEKISPEQEIENLIQEIENATTENLPTFKLAAAKNIRTIGAFKKRQKQLGIS